MAWRDVTVRDTDKDVIMNLNLERVPELIGVVTLGLELSFQLDQATDESDVGIRLWTVLVDLLSRTG